MLHTRGLRVIVPIHSSIMIMDVSLQIVAGAMIPATLGVTHTLCAGRRQTTALTGATALLTMHRTEGEGTEAETGETTIARERVADNAQSCPLRTLDSTNTTSLLAKPSTLGERTGAEETRGERGSTISCRKHGDIAVLFLGRLICVG